MEYAGHVVVTLCQACCDKRKQGYREKKDDRGCHSFSGKMDRNEGTTGCEKKRQEPSSESSLILSTFYTSPWHIFGISFSRNFTTTRLSDDSSYIDCHLSCH